MPLKTSLNTAPYFDDYDERKDYYRVLFKPGFSVQTRELNQIQSMWAQQLERFGDNIFKNGSIVSGVNFQFHDSYPYVKLSDVTVDGKVVSPGSYLGRFVEEEGTGLRAYVVNFADGFVESAPDLKTIYVRYNNSGDDGETSRFTPGSILRVSSGQNGVESVVVNNGVAGYSNNDTLVFTPALLVNVHSGSFASGEYLSSPELSVNVRVTSVNTSAVPGKVVLKFKPRDEDLQNAAANSSAWTLRKSVEVSTDGGAVGRIEKVFGAGAAGRIETSGAGRVTDVVVTSRGSGYEFAPEATVKTSNASVQVDLLDLEPRTYLARVQVPSSVPDVVGEGYAFSVDEGVVYHSGAFLRVSPQTIIVSKYSTSPNNVVATFGTVEEIVDSNDDASLLDNASGEPNENAPGADRLRITPFLRLVGKEEAEANSDFLSLVEWNDGEPVIQNRSTTFNKVSDAIAESISDSSGSFVLDAFQVTTESVANTSKEGTHYTAVIDPGQGYIRGYKVQTLSNYKIDVRKGLDRETSNSTISLSYGNYLRVRSLRGDLSAATGGEVELYSSPHEYDVDVGTITPLGDKVATARVRAVELESGVPGTDSAVYRVYLFLVAGEGGRDASEARAVYKSGAYDAIANVITETDPATGEEKARFRRKNDSQLLFAAGVDSLRDSSDTTYEFRTAQTIPLTVSNATIGVALSGASDEYFAYSRELTPAEMLTLIVTPLEADLMTANLAGDVSTTPGSPDVVGNSTAFDSVFRVGDYIFTEDGVGGETRQITSITNATHLTVSSSFSIDANNQGYRRVFPKNVPVPLGLRDGLSANVDSAGKSLTIHLSHANGTPLTLDHGGATLDTHVTFDAERRGVTSSLKTCQRNRYVKIAIANSAGGSTGPWCLGVPDVFRLRGVFVGSSPDVSASDPDVTTDFFVDHSQRPDYLGLSRLKLKPESSLSLSDGDHLLVVIDYFTRDAAGYFDTRSYLRTANSEAIAAIEAKTFEELRQSDAASPWEIPEVYSDGGDYFDLINQLDFRPAADATATPGADPASAPTNPDDTLTFSALARFPKPDSSARSTLTYYLGRMDEVYIGKDSNIFIEKGAPNENPKKRYVTNHPKDALKLQVLHVPPYPNLPRTIRNSIMAVVDTRVGSERFSNKRKQNHAILPYVSQASIQIAQPMVYTMEDIGNLERRIKDLEYYTSLSLVETDIANRTIPSSIDRSLNRFKFGFFADDFENFNNMETDDPQFAADIEVDGQFTFGSFERGESHLKKKVSRDENSTYPVALNNRFRSYLVPPKHLWMLKHFTDNLFWVDERVISQTGATLSVDDCVVVANEDSTLLGEAYLTTVNRRVSRVFLEGLPGKTTIYFQIYSGQQGLGGRLDVYDAGGNNIVASTNSTSGDVQSLTQEDIELINNEENAEQFRLAITQTGLDVPFSNFVNSDFGRGAGKIVLPDGSAGEILLNFVSNDFSPNYKALVVYPSVLSADSTVVNTPECDPNPPVFVGDLEAGELTIVQWSCSNLFRSNAQNYRAFVLEASGLKPNTVHKLFLDSDEWKFVIELNQQLKNQANWTGSYKREVRSDLLGGNQQALSDSLIVSSRRKFNEVYNLMTVAVDKIFNADGSVNETNTRLKTDESGRLRLLVFFPLNVAGWFSQSFDAPSYQVDYSGFDSRTYGKKLAPTYGSSGYTKISLRSGAGGLGAESVAEKIFANRTPNKVIPTDADGSI